MHSTVLTYLLLLYVQSVRHVVLRPPFSASKASLFLQTYMHITRLVVVRRCLLLLLEYQLVAMNKGRCSK